MDSNLLAIAVGTAVSWIAVRIAVIAAWIAVPIIVGTVDGNAKRTFIASGVLIVCRTEIGNPGTDVGVWEGVEFGI